MPKVVGLAGLNAGELEALGVAVRLGKLRSPFSGLGVRRVVAAVTAERAEEIAAELRAYSEAGAPDGAVALFLAGLRESAAGRGRPLEDLVQVVTTGPEVQAGRDTAVVVQELFRNARKSVLISGYRLHQARALFGGLAERMAADSGLQVRMFLDIGSGDEGMNEVDSTLLFVRQFRKHHWPEGCREPEVYYDPRTLEGDRRKRAVLHAKCVVCDEAELFVSSANFTEAAQVRNVEVGLLVRSGMLARQVVDFYEGLVRWGHVRRVVFAGGAAAG